MTMHISPSRRISLAARLVDIAWRTAICVAIAASVVLAIVGTLAITLLGLTTLAVSGLTMHAIENRGTVIASVLGVMIALLLTGKL